MKKKQDIPENKAKFETVGVDDKLPETETSERAEFMDIKDVQLKELSDKYMRLAAEYENYRKRSQREKDGLYNDSIVTVASMWLPVIDNMERGLVAASLTKSEESRKIADGMEMVLQQAKDAMECLGIVEVPALGHSFDPNTMEAVMHEENEDVGENEVVMVLTKGYVKGDKVIRHAVVKVAN